MKTKSMGVLAAVLALLLIFVSCEKSEKQDETAVPIDADFVVAYTKDPDAEIKEAVKRLETERGLKVAVLDYSQFNVPGDKNAGSERLALDLTTGTVKPDLILAQRDSNVVAQTVLNKNLYADLGPYLETDPHINRDNVFGTVLESFTDKDGKIWGLANVMTAYTLLGNDALLGDLAGREGWTVGELLDFAESLPEDVVLSTDTRSPNTSLLGENGYLSFVDLDAGTCSFDSPEFLRWLRFLDGLPTYEEFMLSPLAPKTAEDEADVRYLYYHAGKVALAEAVYPNLQSMVRDPAIFGTKEFTRIGHVGSESIFDLSFNNVFMIGKDAARPDLAWEVIAACMEPQRWPDGRVIPGGTVPVLKDAYDELCEQYYDMYIIADFSGGGGGMAEKDPEIEFTEDMLDEPGYIIEFTEEDALRLKKDLDSRSVTRIADRLPPEIKSIAEEEISAFLAGQSSAEDCVKKIQSRVSIWLAEHK